ncbi:major facilitator superfamily domain-containing protein [Ditylenchus destructor]|nr:major facilitator superfamily domain-containing protein [Ditylenchus destructor]
MMFCVYSWISMRNNLGVAIVCMVNATSSAASSDSSMIQLNNSDLFNAHSMERSMMAKCGRTISAESAGSGYDGTLNWSSFQQSQLFAALFYTSFLTVGISGWIADRFSPKILVIVFMSNYGIFTVLTPFFANSSFYVYLAARFIMGLGDGMVFPCVTSMVARWFPPSERSTAAALYTSGNQIAAGLGAILFTKLCTVTTFLDYGWPNIFYLTGFLTFVFVLLWSIFLTDNPMDNRFVSAKEKLFLSEELSGQHSGMGSRKSYLPSYFRDVVRLDLTSNGWYTATPFLTQLVFKNVFGIGSDVLKRAGLLTDTAACKILQVFSGIGVAITLILMALFVDCTNPHLALFLLSIFGICFAGSNSGAFTASLCIAPPFTGTVVSLCSFTGAVANIIAPTMIGFLNKKGTPEEWSLIFFTAAAINVICGVEFLIWGTAEVQPWAKNEPAEKLPPKIFPITENGRDIQTHKL